MSIGIHRIGGGTACRPLMALTLTLVLAACGLVSRDEVVEARSPDGRLEAVLIETNGGATTSYGYEIWLRETNRGSGEQVAYLYGAIRSESAYGANLRWTNDGQLSIEYLSECCSISNERTAPPEVIVANEFCAAIPVNFRVQPFTKPRPMACHP